MGICSHFNLPDQSNAFAKCTNIWRNRLLIMSFSRKSRKLWSESKINFRSAPSHSSLNGKIVCQTHRSGDQFVQFTAATQIHSIPFVVTQSAAYVCWWISGMYSYVHYELCARRNEPCWPWVRFWIINFENIVLKYKERNQQKFYALATCA